MQILAAPFAGVIAGDYESIATTTVGVSGAGTVTFSSIPATYTHLQIRFLARDSRAATGSYITATFNGDAAANYSWHQLYGTGAIVGAAAGTSTSGTYFSASAGATATANVFGVGNIDILDYANINKYKTLRSLSGFDNNGSGEVHMFSGNWRSTSAITSITLTPLGALFSQYSSFALYGIKG
jgi:hypothetical protein